MNHQWDVKKHWRIDCQTAAYCVAETSAEGSMLASPHLHCPLQRCPFGLSHKHALFDRLSSLITNQIQKTEIIGSQICENIWRARVLHRCVLNWSGQKICCVSVCFDYFIYSCYLQNTNGPKRHEKWEWYIGFWGQVSVWIIVSTVDYFPIICSTLHAQAT